MGFCGCPSGRAMAAGDGSAYLWYVAAHSTVWPDNSINAHRCCPDKTATVTAWREAVEGAAVRRADHERKVAEHHRVLASRSALRESFENLVALGLTLLLGYAAGAGWL